MSLEVRQASSDDTPIYPYTFSCYPFTYTFIHTRIHMIPDHHKRFQEVFLRLPELSAADKIQFLHTLLYRLTIAGRAIWSDNHFSDPEKQDALKWLNELNHRLWNMISECQLNNDADFATHLHGHLQFHHSQSYLLGIQLVPTVVAAFYSFEEQK